MNKTNAVNSRAPGWFSPSTQLPPVLVECVRDFIGSHDVPLIKTLGDGDSLFVRPYYRSRNHRDIQEPLAAIRLPTRELMRPKPQ